MKKFLLIIVFLWSASAIAQQGEYAPASDHKMYYRIFGEGEPMVIINGGPGMNSEGFAGLARDIAQQMGMMTIIYDQRGTGKSVLPEVNSQSITLDLMVTDLEDLRKHLGIEQWVVLGHSFGGMLASYYATKHPNVISKLILSSSGGVDLSLFNSYGIVDKLSQQDRDSLNYWSQRISQGDDSDYARKQRAKHLAPAYVYDKSHVPQIAERLTQGNMVVNGIVFNNMRDMNFDCKEDLKHFEAPTLIIQGKNDVIPTNLATLAHDIIPNSELVLLDKCAHYGWLDQREQYFGALKEFLAK